MEFNSRVTHYLDRKMESGSRFVPHPAVKQGQLLVLSEAVLAARNALVVAQHSGNPDKIAAAWKEHDRVVVEAALVGRSMNEIQVALAAAVEAARTRLSSHLARQLIDGTSELLRAMAACAATETSMSVLFLAISQGQSITRELTEHVSSISAAYDTLLIVFRGLGEKVRAATAIENGETSKAWTQHGFRSASTLMAHEQGQIPESTRRYLTELTVPMLDAGCVLNEQAWRALNATPLGTRVGFLIRYACAESKPLDAIVLFEQLLLHSKRSLLTDDVHRSLRRAVQQKPNSGLPTDARVPILALMMSHRNEGTLIGHAAVPRIIDAVDSVQLLSHVTAQLRVFSKGLSTEAERCAGRVPSINTFFSLSRVFYCLVDKLNAIPSEAVRADQPLTDRQRTFTAMTTLLWLAPRDGSREMLARLFLWWRYAARPDNVPSEHFWKWVPRTELLLGDLRAFVANHPLFSSRWWTFDPYMISLEKKQ